MDDDRRLLGRRAIETTFVRDKDSIEHLNVFDIKSGKCILAARSAKEFASLEYVLENICILVINYKGGRCITQFLKF